jgi:hypothetical protein
MQLDNTNPYEALSYVWGSEADAETLLLCRHEFHVTQNLHSALLALRQPSKDRMLWIDALCINQGNDDEKGTQIPLMGDIYKRAKQVIAWLGSPTNDMMPGLRWLGDVAEAGDIKSCFPKHDSFDDARLGVQLLLSCDYWNRAWVVQEMAFANPFHLQCGPFSIPYTAFLNCLKMASGVTSTVLLSSSHMPNQTIAAAHFRNRSLSPGSACLKPITVTTFLDRLVNKRCRDPRDSVFAFYNLFSRELQNSLPSPTDYCRQTAQNTLLEAICAMILSERSLYAITIKSRQKVPNGKEDNWQHDLPSWCPYVRTPFTLEDSLSDSLGKSNSGTRTADDFFFDNTGKRIRVRGFAIATVSRILARCRHRDLVNRTGVYSDEERNVIIRYYLKCVAFGLELPDVPEVREETSQEGQSPEFYPGGIMTVTDDARDEMHPFITEKAIHYWKLTRPRMVCRFITLDEGLTTDTVGYDLEDTEWVDDPQDNNGAALIPEASHEEDIIARIIGCPLPVVLRKQSGESVYHVVGEAYFKGCEEYVGKTDFEYIVLG